jgi:two-component sensor histidine kinase/PAS domain-containing protein
VTAASGPLPDEVWDSVRGTERQEVLAALHVLNSDPDPDFDRLTKLASRLFNAPIALVTLVDIDRQWFKSSLGLQAFGYSERATPLAASFCVHTIAQKDQPWLVIGDASKDDRFAGKPFVTASPFVRFYAAAPITVRGQRLGCLCVMSPEPREHVDARLMEQLVDLAGVAGSLFDLKDEARVRARTAAELIKEEWRHALTLEAGKVGSWVWDMRTKDVVANDILRRMFDLKPHGPISIDDLFGAMDAGDLGTVTAALKAAFENGEDYVAEFRVAASGRWLMGRGRVYQRDGTGNPLIMMGINIDITETRQSADQTRMLLRELNHRVKNTLAMIQSLARQTLKQTPDPQHFIDSFSGRLRTLSDAHVLLADRDWSGIRLLELIQMQVTAFLPGLPSQLRIDGEDLQLPPDHALGLGLVLHELSSNATKFGALSAPQGLVHLTWSENGGRLILVWKESGGPTVAPPSQKGFGMRLIERGLDKVLDSSVVVSSPPDGVEAVISLPLEEG